MTIKEKSTNHLDNQSVQVIIVDQAKNIDNRICYKQSKPVDMFSQSLSLHLVNTYKLTDLFGIGHL